MVVQIKYTKLFIDNEWVDSKSGKIFPTCCPHDESVIANVAQGDKDDVDIAVAAAKRAFHCNSEWRQLDASQRGLLLNKFADLVERYAQYLSELESYNNGVVISYIQLFMQGCIKSIRYIANCADKIQGATIPAVKIAVPYAANAIFFHQGQVCVAASRLFVQSGIYDDFVEATVKYAKDIKIGNPADPITQYGPQIDKVMFDKVLGYIETGKKEDAKLRFNWWEAFWFNRMLYTTDGICRC